MLPMKGPSTLGVLKAKLKNRFTQFLTHHGHIRQLAPTPRQKFKAFKNITMNATVVCCVNKKINYYLVSMPTIAVHGHL